MNMLKIKFEKNCSSSKRIFFFFCPIVLMHELVTFIFTNETKTISVVYILKTLKY